LNITKENRGRNSGKIDAAVAAEGPPLSPPQRCPCLHPRSPWMRQEEKQHFLSGKIKGGEELMCGNCIFRKGGDGEKEEEERLLKRLVTIANSNNK
jgi:hypothetical protein